MIQSSKPDQGNALPKKSNSNAMLNEEWRARPRSRGERRADRSSSAPGGAGRGRLQGLGQGSWCKEGSSGIDSVYDAVVDLSVTLNFRHLRVHSLEVAA